MDIQQAKETTDLLRGEFAHHALNEGWLDGR